MADRLQNGHDRFSFFRQTVFGPRQYFIIGLADKEAIMDELLERRHQDLVGNIIHFVAQLTVTQNTVRC